MPPTTIPNPILNTPYEEPDRHFRFGEDGITDEIVESRRTSAYFIPIAPTKKKGKKQLQLEKTQWTSDRVEENAFINRVRARVARFRQGDYPGVTPTTRRLLEHWNDTGREPRLFFCQREALETAIYLAEAARREGDAWIENELREANEGANPGLYRLALKMATGSGKTLIMAMLIAWQALNKIANPQDKRFSDAFLVVAPGITVRDRLRVLLPGDAENYYGGRWNLVPPELRGQLHRAKIEIVNFHRFIRRDTGDAARLTKAILTRGSEESPFLETPDQMVRRVLRDLGGKKNIVVLNDEAHHCYRPKESAKKEKLTRDERAEATREGKKAHVWISGLEAIQKKIGIRAIYDLSATPFFLKGSGYSEGTLFPWVVSDFSLIDAIEAGLVKVPRVPVADDSMTGPLPTYRELWSKIRDDLPKKGRTAGATPTEPDLPAELEGALQSLYGHYEQHYAAWEAGEKERSGGSTPPVFIVVCNNTAVSKLVYDYISGWEKQVRKGESVLVPGKLALFDNVEAGSPARWRARPNTVLIDSEQLESGDALAPAFKKLMAHEIEEWKDEFRARFPGRDPDQLTDSDLLREVMNTVGKKGKLGEGVRCVVSVSMLTEGWDASTVTHILGVRAFGTQLLCEQVIGRGLRRRSYALNEKRKFSPEYAEVYGVPFSFIPTSGSIEDPKPDVEPTHVRALPDRAECEIAFPRLEGYRWELPSERLEAQFDDGAVLHLSTRDVPTEVENAPIVGESAIHTLDDLKARRLAEVDFQLARRVLERYFRGGVEGEEEDGDVAPETVQAWRFPEILAIARRWREQCLVLSDDVFPQLLLLSELSHQAAGRIYRSIVRAAADDAVLLPILRRFEPEGSTRWVEFDTRRPVWVTDPEKCHVSHVVADTESWEQKMAQSLEKLDPVEAYVKNDNLGFTIPYSDGGITRSYVPDFIARIDDGGGHDDPLHLVLEVSGERRKDKQVKVDTAKSLWVPAVNNARLGRWGFLEITDPWQGKQAILDWLGGGER